MTFEAPRIRASSVSRTWSSQDEKFIFVTLTTGLLLAFAFQLVYFAFRTSATVDEPVHLLAGYRHWQCGDFGINPEHPPLLKLIAAAPLMFRIVGVLTNWTINSTNKPKMISPECGAEMNHHQQPR